MTQISPDQVLAEYEAAGALLRGHFILSSGKRSPMYLQSALVMRDPERAERLCKALAAKAADLRPDCVVAPAMGGILVGHELARALRLPSMFVERVEGKFALRRGFAIPKGARVLIAEDIVTTGLSTDEAAACCREHGGEVVGVACLIDRTAGKARLGFPLISLAALDLPVYEPDRLPPELAALPPVKPGSRQTA